MTFEEMQSIVEGMLQSQQQFQQNQQQFQQNMDYCDELVCRSSAGVSGKYGTRDELVCRSSAGVSGKYGLL